MTAAVLRTFLASTAFLAFPALPSAQRSDDALNVGIRDGRGKPRLGVACPVQMWV